VLAGHLRVHLVPRHGLTLRWYDVLLQVHAAPGGRLTMRDLGRAVVISKSGLTGLVDRMEREGLVDEAAVVERALRRVRDENVA
jgi:DNA-binding MarR family transcriptional regulator